MLLEMIKLDLHQERMISFSLAFIYTLCRMHSYSVANTIQYFKSNYAPQHSLDFYQKPVLGIGGRGPALRWEKNCFLWGTFFSLVIGVLLGKQFEKVDKQLQICSRNHTLAKYHPSSQKKFYQFFSILHIKHVTRKVHVVVVQNSGKELCKKGQLPFQHRLNLFSKIQLVVYYQCCVLIG